ncbi:MAG: DUF501 domain-containing protein [Acidimicrobiales bacterium]
MVEEHPSSRDTETVARLLGRDPLGRFSVAARSVSGDPIVIKNVPFLDDGTPMPTIYWLVGERECAMVGRLESTGGVRRAEREIPADVIAEMHIRYAAERDVSIVPDHQGPRPSGGVGGTRRGVKCLHTHYADYLAGWRDPVGVWVHNELVAAGEI